ncbi:Uncharacterized protein TPAR_06245 [Tolypocladium paradoxum]|uniref:NB-ARC domain-containing protein n=1 Tax=Tolypocladium paradoxum TaxID=94208 RepID=A0A2S4KTM7_9HYPO|nr:Uncharacterized protein TPAR_06245 [Tolypocladium paradoxum]
MIEHPVKRARAESSSLHTALGVSCAKKEAILLSRNNPEPHLRNVFSCVLGVMFMGTLHRGSWMAKWASIPASVFGFVRPTNKSILATLQTDNQLLQSIQTHFLSMVWELRENGRRLEVACFLEELPLSRKVGEVVSRECATLEGYPSASIHANHRDMVKFDSEDNIGFVRLLGELRRWGRVPTSAPAGERVPDTFAHHAALPYYHIPFPKNNRFVGRQSTMETLKRMLFLQQDCRKASLFGLGGAGKTQVALYLAYWAKEHQTDCSVLWVAALSDESFG